jgi:hypothetical protein
MASASAKVAWSTPMPGVVHVAALLVHQARRQAGRQAGRQATSEYTAASTVNWSSPKQQVTL